MKLDRTGCTRLVILTKRYAIKLPDFTIEWRLFLHGLLANMQERNFSTSGWPELCPVLFSLPGGFLVVMPRVRLLTDQEFDQMNYAEWIKGGKTLPKGEWIIPVEPKSNSFGWLDGRIVAIDYGN